MEPITLMIGFILLSTNSVDLVLDDELVDGFINYNDSIITLDSWVKSNNGYFGTTEDGDNFYLIVTDDSLKIKIWQDDNVIRIVESLI